MSDTITAAPPAEFDPRGARFVLVRNRQILGSIDVETGEVVETPIGSGYSPRARDYTGEPALSDLALAARGRFGRGEPGLPA